MDPKAYQSVRHQQRIQKKRMEALKKHYAYLPKYEQRDLLPYEIKGFDYLTHLFTLPKKGYVKNFRVNLKVPIPEKEVRKRVFLAFGDLKSSEEGRR